MTESAQKLQTVIDRARKIVFFGGAGVSTESGIPDFRSEDGLYRQSYAYPPEQILSHRFFMENPAEFYRFYREKMLTPWAKPGKAHRKLKELEDCGKLIAVVTQNIDGLHSDAGCRRVLELHGCTRRNYCVRCGKKYPMEAISESEGVPHCVCGGVIRPDVVLYEEGLDDDIVSGAVSAIATADMLIIAGTSLTVYPAAGLVNYFRGTDLILINRDATPMDSAATLVFHEKVGELLDQIIIR